MRALAGCRPLVSRAVAGASSRPASALPRAALRSAVVSAAPEHALMVETDPFKADVAAKARVGKGGGAAKGRGGRAGRRAPTLCLSSRAHASLSDKVAKGGASIARSKLLSTECEGALARAVTRLGLGVGHVLTPLTPATTRSLGPL